MQVIYKYQFKIESEFSIMMPGLSVILKVAYQHSVPTLWAIVNPDGLEYEYHFRIYGTGHEIKHIRDLHYIDTLFDIMTGMVWHVFSNRTFYIPIGSKDHFSTHIDSKDV